jgi:hypothetical protein
MKKEFTERYSDNSAAVQDSQERNNPAGSRQTLGGKVQLLLSGSSNAGPNAAGGSRVGVSRNGWMLTWRCRDLVKRKFVCIETRLEWTKGWFGDVRYGGSEVEQGC